MGPAQIWLKISAWIAWRETYPMLLLSTHLFSHWSIPLNHSGCMSLKKLVSWKKLYKNCLSFLNLLFAANVAANGNVTSYMPSVTLFANTASYTTQWKIWAHNSRNIVPTHWAITRHYMGKNNTLFAYKGTGNRFAALWLTTTHAPVLVPGSWFLVHCS
jgi:hypothetical protein